MGELMCPHCGQRVRTQQGLVAPHDWPTMIAQCPGSEQIPRSIHDRRRLWSGNLNPHHVVPDREGRALALGEQEGPDDV